MAGSRKWFRYESDSTNIFAIQLDESNTEAVMSGATDDFDYTDTTTVSVAVPRNIKPRTVVYSNNERTREIICTVPTIAQFAAINAGTAAQTIPDPIAGTGNLFLVRTNGERRTLPFASDTGLNDGDAT